MKDKKVELQAPIPAIQISESVLKTMNQNLKAQYSMPKLNIPTIQISESVLKTMNQNLKAQYSMLKLNIPTTQFSESLLKVMNQNLKTQDSISKLNIPTTQFSESLLKIMNQNLKIQDSILKLNIPITQFSESLLKVMNKRLKIEYSISKLNIPTIQISESILKLMAKNLELYNSISTIDRSEFQQKLREMVEASKYSISQNLLSKEIINIAKESFEKNRESKESIKKIENSLDFILNDKKINIDNIQETDLYEINRNIGFNFSENGANELVSTKEFRDFYEDYPELKISDNDKEVDIILKKTLISLLCLILILSPLSQYVDKIITLYSFYEIIWKKFMDNK